VRAAEDIILSGRVVSAAKLHELGIVDVLAKDGMGESAVQQWIATNACRRNGIQALHNVRRICNPIARAELDAVAETWVDAALRLEGRDLKMMNWLVRGQQRRMQSAAIGDAAAAPAEQIARAV
jgi:DSF synthase